MAEHKDKRNRRTAWLLVLVVGGMFGFGFAMVPLYSLICQAAGIQYANPFSAAQTRSGSSEGVGRMVTVKFDATVQDDLPWAFEPNVRSVRVPLGKMQQVSFTARNLTENSITGQAIPNVVPWQATDHFAKTECFCFRRQTLKAGEEKEMPLVFNVSPALPEGIDVITLSYSFMNVDAALDRQASRETP